MLALDGLGLAGRLAPVSFSLGRGESLVLLGPTGAGKSTLLRLIAGLEVPTCGRVTVGGVDVTHLEPHRRGVALLPQKTLLYPELTVAKNLALVGPVAPEVSRILDLAPLLSRKPGSLSGGEVQRVALAKLVASGRGVWLLDEPMGGLDFGYRQKFRRDLHLLARGSDATMVIVTHDPADAWALGPAVGVLDAGQVRQLGPVSELRADPSHQGVAACLGRVGFLAGRVGGDRPGAKQFVSRCGAIRLPAPADSQVADNLTLGLWPCDVTPAVSPTPGLTLAGWQACSAEPDGSGWLVLLSAPDDSGALLLAHDPAGSTPPVSTPTDWTVSPHRGLWFRLPTGDRLSSNSVGPDILSGR